MSSSRRSGWQGQGVYGNECEPATQCTTLAPPFTCGLSECLQIDVLLLGIMIFFLETRVLKDSQNTPEFFIVS